MKTRTVKYLGLALAAAGCVTQANAGLWTIGDYGLLVGGNVLTIDGYNETALAGGIKLTEQSSGNQIVTVCTDIRGSVSQGQQIYYAQIDFNGTDINGLNPNWGAGNAGSINNTPNIPANAAFAIQNAAELFAENAVNPNGTPKTLTANQWAALQLSVWEALYDSNSKGNGNLSLGSGRFSVSSSPVLGSATTYLANLSSTYNNRTGSLLVPVKTVGGVPQKDANGEWIYDLNTQEMLIGITPVPEPTTVIAGILLLLPFGVSTLRMMRKNRAL